jgi:hypothetical protein
MIPGLVVRSLVPSIRGLARCAMAPRAEGRARAAAFRFPRLALPGIIRTVFGVFPTSDTGRRTHVAGKVVSDTKI